MYLQLVGVVTVSDTYEERLTEIFPGAFNHLRLLALDPYDIALSKIERNNQRDRDDVRHLARTVPFDLITLKERYQNELSADAWFLLSLCPETCLGVAGRGASRT